MSDQLLLDLSLKVDHLTEQVAALTEQVARLTVKIEAATSSSRGFQLVSGAGSVTAPSQASCTSSNGEYNRLAALIPPVPDFVVQLCVQLTSSKLHYKVRASRAWEAGYWARFTLEGQISKPRPTGPIELPNSYYVVLRAEGFSCPLVCTKASDYRSVVGDFLPSTVSHGFPTQAEARAYCQGAGVEYPASVYQWSSSR